MTLVVVLRVIFNRLSSANVIQVSKSVFCCLSKFKIKRIAYRNKREFNVMWETKQLTYTCSKLIIETVKKGVKYVQS